MLFSEVQEISFVDIILVVPEIFCVQTISFTALPVLEILTVWDLVFWCKDMFLVKNPNSLNGITVSYQPFYTSEWAGVKVLSCLYVLQWWAEGTWGTGGVLGREGCKEERDKGLKEGWAKNRNIVRLGVWSEWPMLRFVVLNVFGYWTWISQIGF